MLYLNPPYFLINGVSIFPDSDDKLQFYYMPMMPHLTMVTDPTTSASTPQLTLIEYTGSAGTGGFLDFDVNLGLDDGALSEVTGILQRKLNLTQQPVLSPVTFVDGSVRLLILGAASTGPSSSSAAAASGSTSGSSSTPVVSVTTTTAPTTGPQFVTKIESATKPALYGDNQATFSVQLDQYGATILEQALQGAMAPVAVIYSLQFLALRPAFHVHLTADWNRVQTYLDSQYSGGFLFFSTSIDKSVDKLIEDKVINIQVDTYQTDSGMSAGAQSDEQRAVAQCYELIKSTFFQSSLPPPNPNAPDDWSKAEQAFTYVSDMALTGGNAGVASFSYKNVDLTRIDQKSLNFDMSERTAVLQTIYPQGHLSGLLSELSQKGFDLTKYIERVDLSNPFFQERKIQVLSYADFNGDSIASIDVNLNYNGNTQSVQLATAGTQTEVDWTSVLQNGKMLRPVTYDYTVNFKNVDTTQRPGKLSTKSGVLSVVGDVLDIEPRTDLYGMTTVPIRAFGFPWDRYPSVEVECKYVDAANGINLQPSAVLNSQNTEVDWSLFMVDLTNRSFQYRLTYSLAAGGTIVSPWTTTSDAKIDIVDPFPSKITLTILAALDWSKFAEALVFVAYPSKTAPVAQQSYTLNAANATAPLFEVDRQDPTQTLVYYEARLIGRDGSVWTVPGSVTSSQYLILQNGMKGHQIISIVPEQVDFTAKQITGINVQLRYVDPANSLNIQEAVSLASASDARSFSYDYINDQVAPQYRADVALQNGQTKSIDWTQISGNVVTIPLSTLVN